MRIAFDLETDGLLPELTRIHCLCALPEGAPAVLRYHDDPTIPRDGTIAQGLALLEGADQLWAHNGQEFDYKVIRKLYPRWMPRGTEMDSLIAARTVWPEQHLKRLDAVRVKQGRPFPGNLVGRHSLEAWGHRLRDRKGEKPSSWAALTADMVDYCAQDTVVLDLLVRRVLQHEPSALQLKIEHCFAAIVAAQERRGMRLDADAVRALAAALTTRRAELNDALTAMFPPFEDEYVTPKKQLRRVRKTPFNPNSREHIARALRERHGWRPEKFTPTGRPKVDEAVIGALPYPEAKILAERLMIQTRLGQVAEGNEAWLKVVQADGRVHGRMAHNAAVTSRCTHSKPNMSAVPKMKKPWGPECRRCWRASDGNRLVVVDAAGIDARMIGHYSARFDGGAFAQLLLEGDIHTRNLEVIGDAAFWSAAEGRLHDKPREIVKKVFYAILYGAQGPKVGKILGIGPEAGERARRALLRSLPGLGLLIRSVESKARARGWLRTLDGRRLWVRKNNAALNTLAQGGAAIAMKTAIVIASPWTFKYQVAFVHDEIVLDVPEGLAQEAAVGLVGAIQDAGRQYKLRLALDAKAAIGLDWSCK